MVVTSRQSGFTLVEVLIAASIAIAAMGLLLNFFAASLNQMAHLEQQSQQLIVEKALAVEFAEINPAATTGGTGKMGEWTYQWRTDRITPFTQGTDFLDGEIPPRHFALFLITVELKQGEQKTRQFELKQLGWRA